MRRSSTLRYSGSLVSSSSFSTERRRSITRARRWLADISSEAVAVRKNAGASIAVRMA